MSPAAERSTPLECRDSDASYDAVCDRGDLTRRQLLIWAGDRLGGGAPVFVETALLHLRGPLDPARLGRAFEAVVAESDALQTAIDDASGWPRRTTSRPLTPAIDLIDLTGGSTAPCLVEALARDGALRCGRAGHPFVDALVVRLGPEHHVLVVAQHQLVSDAWSFWLVHRRLLAHYQGAVCDPELGPSSIPRFGEFVAYERRFRASPRAQAAREYWQRCQDGLAGTRPDRPAPVDVPDPIGGSTATRVHRIVQRLGRPRSLALRALAAEIAPGDVGTFVVVAGVAAAHAHATSGSRDVVLSVPFANRPSERFKRTIGSFMNVVPVRVDVAGADTFADLTNRLARETWEAAKHQGWAGRIGAVPQRYDVLVNVHRATVAAGSFGECAMEVEWLAPTHRFGAVAVAVHDFGATGELSLVLDLNEGMFGRASRETFAASLLGVLDGCLADPRRRLASIEKGSGSRSSPSSARPIGRPQTVWTRFVSQAARTPNAIAVRVGARTVSYEELRAGAERVAALLVAHDVAPQALVAIWGERDLAWLQAMLGVWCRGAVYLPLDADWPAARVAQVLQQSRAGLVLAGRIPSVLQAAAVGASWTLVSLDPEASAGETRTISASAIAAGSGGVDPEALAGEGLAYVLYTSGSTGVPKGALIEQAGLLNHLDAKIALLDLQCGDRMAQTAGAGFDVSLWQCLAPLLVGAAVEVIDPATARDPQALCTAVARSGITVLETIPGLLDLLLAAEDRTTDVLPSLASLRWLVVTGEALAPELCRRWLRRYPEIPIVNAYGPTECADDVTHHVVRTPPAGDAMHVPIGRPIPGMTVHVLDAALQPVAPGEAGELCVSGIGVGRGYLHDPERTAAAFVMLEARPGRAETRVYRTGDRGRWRTDGVLEWLGRLDTQVKIHGQRVEPGEVEAVVAAHPAVRQVAVVVHAGESAPARLVAYVVLDEAFDVGGDETSDGSDATHVDAWRRLWDDTYARESPRAAVPSFNVAGWTSRFTRLPIPEREMREWLDHTIDRMLALQPKRVLEIGCGSGMVLCRVAPGCECYVATDVSRAAVEYVTREHLGTERLRHVAVAHAAADAVRVESVVDTVLMNSVVQYFPSLGYLERVLRVARAQLGERGVVFVGDVRHLGLAPMLHTAVELARASASCTVAELRARIARSLAHEAELLVAPAFFVALARACAGPSRVDIQLKRGRSHNELTRFRYDVVWQVGVDDVTPAGWLGWREGSSTVETVRRWVGERADACFGVRGIPNARLQREQAAVRVLAAAGERDTVAVLHEAIRAAEQAEGVDPEELWAMADLGTHDVSVHWSPVGGDRVDVVFRPRGRDTRSGRRTIDGRPVALRPPDASRWRDYANDPRRHAKTRSVLAAVRAFVAARLPAAMVPAALVPMPSLPLTGNGKVDRARLASGTSGTEGGATASPPSSDGERAIATLWSALLGVSAIGREDDFFALGGDSLLVYRLLLELRAALGVELAVERFLADPTVAGVAAAVGSRSLAELSDADVGALLQDVESLSDAEVAALLGADHESAARGRTSGNG